MFLKSVPLKPKRAIDLSRWKGEMSSCINNGITVVQDFVKKHKLKKETKRKDITVALLSETKYIELILNQLKDNSEHMLDTPDIHIDNSGDNNENVNY